MTIALIIAAWLACGIGGAGFCFAYFQGRYPTLAARDRREDLGNACLVAMFGPLGLVIAFCLSGFGEYGWRLR